MDSELQRRFNESMQKLSEVLQGGFISEEEFHCRQQKLHEEYQFDQHIASLQQQTMHIAAAPVVAVSQLVSLSAVPFAPTPAPAPLSKPLSASATKRLQAEVQSSVSSPSEGIAVEFPANNLRDWKVTMLGPPSSPYEGGTWTLSLTVPDDYPFKPPAIRFVTPVYHPNINGTGAICLDILKDHWSPALTILRCLDAIRHLLASPNPHDPLNPEAAKLFLSDRAAYNARVVSSIFPNQPAAAKTGPLSFNEKQALSNAICNLAPDVLARIVELIQEGCPLKDGEEIELDIDLIPPVTLRKIKEFVEQKQNVK